jgi:protocatechuate 3,4-dioxygenase beta subunit
MRRRGVWLLAFAVLAAGALVSTLLLSDGPLDLLDGEGHAAEGAVAGPGVAEAGGLSALSSEQQARDRAKAEAAAKAAAAPKFTKAEGVFGRVVDKRGAAVPGARLSLFAPDPAAPWGAPDGPPVATATSGADGAYLIGPAPERQRLKLQGQATGFSTALAWVQTRGACQDLELDRGGAVRVTVKDEAGKAVAGAEVAYPNTATVVPTGADGIALLESLPPGQAGLRVSMRGFASAHINDAVVEPGKTLERSVVLVRGTTLEGQVVDAAGAPVAEAAVAVKSQLDNTADAAAPTTSDPDGRFTTVVSGGPSEWLQVVATKDGFTPGVTGVMLQQSGQPTNVVVKLGAEASVAGRVEDRDGRPVAGATVVYARQHRYPGSPRANQPTTSDENGLFSLPLPQAALQEGQTLYLAARAPKHGAGGATTKPPKAGEPPPPPVVIKLGGAGAVAGTVEDASGRPVEGATVTLSMDRSGRPVQLASGAVRNEDWTTRLAVQDPRLTRLSASTDASGAFRIDDVPVGTFAASVVFGLDTDGGSEPVTVRADAVETVKLTTGTGGTIEGVVLDGSDAPVAGAWIHAHDPVQRGGQGWRSAQARSDSDGRFVLRGVRGDSPWQLGVNAPGYKPPEARQVRPGEKDVTLRVTVLGWIEGVVVADGKPYGRPFAVSAQAQQPHGNRPMQYESVEWVAQGGSWRAGGGGASGQFVSADGTFVLRGLAAGSYVLNVTTRDGLIPVVTPPVSVSDGRASGPVEIALERGATLAGVVVDEATRQPVAQAWVNLNVRGQAQSGGATSSNTQTDAKGRFAAPGLATGTYTVQVTPPAGVAFDDEVALERGRTEERTFLAPRAGAVLVRVVDGEGKPVENAQVNFLTERGTNIQPNWEALRREGKVDMNRPDWWQRLVQTDASGTLLRTLLPAGRLQVHAYPPNGKPSGAVWVAVAGDETVEVRVVVERAGEAAPGK